MNTIEMNEPLFSKQFDVDIIDITIETEAGNKMDLRPLLVQMNIYEDLFSPTLSGNISLSDTNDLLGKLPIVGREKITVVFKTPGLASSPSEVRKTFFTYKVDNVVKDEKIKLQSYTIFFASKEFLQNARLLVSKSYKGSPSEIFQKVFDEYFPKTKRPIVVSPSKNNISFVCPGWKPFAFINWLSDISVSQDYPDSSRTLFYETLDGFYFRDVSEMFEQEIEFTYTNNPQLKYNIDSVNTASQIPSSYSIFNQIVQIDIVGHSDPYDRLKNGVYSNTLLEHDITNKLYTFAISNYKDEFSRINHIYQNQVISNIDSLFDSPMSLTMFVPLNGTETDYQKTRPQRITQINQLNQQQIAITVHGNHTLRVGKKANVTIPRSIDLGTTKNYKDALDETFTGDYLISAVRHTLTGQGYSCRVELIRDTLYRSLPDIVKQK